MTTQESHIEKEHFDLCRLLIEEKMAWGPSSSWHSQEFEVLSQEIFAKTAVNLSVTTLKRFWGRVKYENLPSISTLDTLARFLDFESWRDFRVSNQQNHPVKVKIRSIKRVWYAVPLILIIVVSWLFIETINKPVYPVDDIQFSSEYVSTGLPNTVVFSFNLADIKSENLCIQQSWDRRKRVEINKEQSATSAIYYLPGYFRAKLMADETVLKEHDVFIKTSGWMATINKEPKPEYILENHLIEDGVLKISDLKYNELVRKDEGNILAFHYYDDPLPVTGDNFIFETSVRNTFKTGKSMCQSVNVVIHFTEGVFIIPLSIPGCVGDLAVMMMDSYLNSEMEDMSAFGTNIQEFQQLRIETKEKVASIFLNDQPIRKIAFTKSTGEFVGFRFNFEGAGEIDYVRISDFNDNLLLEESF